MVADAVATLDPMKSHRYPDTSLRRSSCVGRAGRQMRRQSRDRYRDNGDGPLAPRPISNSDCALRYVRSSRTDRYGYTASVMPYRRWRTRGSISTALEFLKSRSDSLNIWKQGAAATYQNLHATIAAPSSSESTQSYQRISHSRFAER